jgi:hypothetical protein
MIDGFSVEPAVARRAATICRNQVAFFVDIVRRIDPCRIDDFGDCQMGRSLSDKFARKIAFDTTGIQQPLLKAVDQLTELADRFDAMAGDYGQLDGQGARALGVAGETC